MKYIASMMIGGAMFALAYPALASGSMGGGASGAQLGQRVYMQKVACHACPFAGGLRTPDQVDMALAKIDGSEIKMSDSEKKAVITFINRRFKGL